MRIRLACAAMLLAAGPLVAAEKLKIPTTGDPQELAAKIDQHIAKRWTEMKVEPAPLTDDAEFVRRVYLDVAGRIPSVTETREFLKDTRPDKRIKLVEQLTDSQRYVTHFVNFWRALLIPEAGNNFQVKLAQGSFELWLRQQIAKNAGYDQMVRDIINAKIDGNGGPLAIFGGNGPSPLTFYLSKEYKPENLAASAARVFLGVSVECAQCHNHPFASWKREQFWSFAAFFSGIESSRVQDFLIPSKDDVTQVSIAIPGTDKKVKAKYLDGAEPKWNVKKPGETWAEWVTYKPNRNARKSLSEWVTSPTNPYFAKAAVNRVWAYFFGTGLVEPINEMAGGDNKPSHPELLDMLAADFAKHQFDMKYLIRAITSTKAYQLTSASQSRSPDDPTLFARMPMRGMTAEQLFDSIAMATGYRDSGTGDDLISGILGGQRSARAEFLSKFAPPERAVDTQTSILNALTLMNGKVVADATSLKRSETLGAILESPFADSAERVEALYMAALSRKPSEKENARAVKFIEDAVAAAKPKHELARKASSDNALADLFWALLNGPEFVLNH